MSLKFGIEIDLDNPKIDLTSILTLASDLNPCGPARFSGPRYVVAARKSSNLYYYK